MNAVRQDLILELEQEAAATRAMLERLPADRFDWRPHPKSMTLGQLALHVATNLEAVTLMAEGDGLDVSTVDLQRPSAESVEATLNALETGVAMARAFLERLDEGRAAATWRLHSGGKELLAVPRIAMVRDILFNHWYHHRGQLSVYLRMLDVPLPMVYGPTADESPYAAGGPGE